MAEEFNPADHKVDEVKAYVKENPDDAQRVLQAEKDGENRTTLVSALEESLKSVPVAADPKPVTVAPAATPDAQSYSFFGKDYERTADGGFRQAKK